MYKKYLTVNNNMKRILSCSVAVVEILRKFWVNNLGTLFEKHYSIIEVKTMLRMLTLMCLRMLLTRLTFQYPIPRMTWCLSGTPSCPWTWTRASSCPSSSSPTTSLGTAPRPTQQVTQWQWESRLSHTGTGGKTWLNCGGFMENKPTWILTRPRTFFNHS